MSGEGEPLAIRVYRRLLALLPHHFRRDRGPAMTAMLEDEWRELGHAARLVTFVRSVLDLLWIALLERVSPSSGGVGWRAFSALDFRLGLRMLVRYPALTAVGGLAMAFGIWVAALTFEVVRETVAPVLPLDDGDRIVGIRHLDREAGRSVALFREDFTTWRGELRSIDGLSAFRTTSRNLIVEGGTPRSIDVAEMSATGFEVARVAPLLGRTLGAADEERGAPGVVVLGYELWQSAFAGDPEIVGTSVGIGARTSTVVGVMPEGFTFPVAHQAWTPLVRSPVDPASGGGGRVAVFGRLAAGAGLEEAQAELDVVGARRARDAPDAAGLVRPRVMPYARSVVPVPDIGGPGLLAVNAFVVMLLLLLCANVALLVFARAATREREIAVRSALGAGRGRIVGQLFAEALVLAGVAAAVGLVAAGFGKKWYVAMMSADAGGAIPFWIRDGLAPATVLYLIGLMLLGAAVAGVGPALKVTGLRLESRLRRVASGVTGLRLSGIWTPVVIAQVGITLAFPVTAFFFHRYVEQIPNLDLGFAAEQYLTARLEESGVADGALDRRSASTRLELAERLAVATGVTGVTFANRVPGDPHPRPAIEIDAGTTESDRVPMHRASVAAVDPDFFRVLGAPVRVGRGFDSGDLGPAPRVAIVNRAFVDEILGGRSAVGRRLRRAPGESPEPGPWLEIVGVAENLGMVGGDFELRAEPGFYRPLDPREAGPVQMTVHVPGRAGSFSPSLRATAAAVDPDLQLHDVRPLDRVSESRWRESEFLARIVTGVSAVALILSLMTIYSVLSFTVSRRTREIGVRVALGSSRGRIIRSVFRGPLIRVGAGLALGMLFVSLLTRGFTGPLTRAEVALVALYTVAMLGVCLLGCVVPMRRALGVEPTEALRAE